MGKDIQNQQKASDNIDTTEIDVQSKVTNATQIKLARKKRNDIAIKMWIQYTHR